MREYTPDRLLCPDSSHLGQLLHLSFTDATGSFGIRQAFAIMFLITTRAKIHQGSKFAALIGKCAVIGRIKQQTFVGKEDCLTSPKSVCVGGYNSRRLMPV